MIKTIKIFASPFHAPVEVVGDIVMVLHGPTSPISAVVIIDPNIQEYEEDACTKGLKRKQLIVTTNTKGTITLKFDFSDNVKHDICVDDKNYSIRLLNIGQEKIQGQFFSFYEFNVESF